MDDFEILFLGLCAHLLNKAEDEATVLLVDSAHLHNPKLSVKVADLANESDAEFFKDDGVEGWLELDKTVGGIDFRGCDVKVKPGGSPAASNSLKIKGTAGWPMKECPKKAIDDKNLAWFPDLNRLGGKDSRKDLALPNLPSGVIYRVFLTEGDFACSGHAAEKKDVRQYTFGRGAPGAIADRALYSLKTNYKTVDLSFERDGALVHTLSLELPTQIRFGHLPPSTHAMTIDAHFDAFYDLLDSGADRVPPVDANRSCTSKPRLDNVPFRPCPQAVLRQT